MVSAIRVRISRCSLDLSEGTAYLKKLARERDREHLKEVRANLKARGVPWYKRLFLRL